MNKNELVNAVTEDSGLTKKDAEMAVKSVFENISKALESGEKVQLIGFGTFETRKRSARKGKNPQTGKEIDIPEATAPAFKAGRALKDRVNK